MIPRVGYNCDSSSRHWGTRREAKCSQQVAFPPKRETGHVGTGPCACPKKCNKQCAIGFYYPKLNSCCPHVMQITNCELGRPCIACLKRLVLKRRLLPLMRWLRLCLRRAATSFFSTAKKGSKKCRSHAPRGALHSANRSCSSTTCVGLQGGLQDECALRDGLARCARWFYLMVFCDGLVAMAFLNDGVTSRESFAGRISHHIRATENQFSITFHRFSGEHSCRAKHNSGPWAFCSFC